MSHQFKPDVARALLAKACNHAAHAEEAKSFAMGFAKWLAAANLTFDDLSFGGETKKLQARVRELQQQVLHLARHCEERRSAHADTTNDLRRAKAERDAIKEAYAALHAKYERLQAENAALREGTAASDTGDAYMRFSVFRQRATAIYGRDRWKSAFATAAGISIKELNAWETVDTIPAALAVKLDALTEEQRRPASRKPWTGDDIKRLKQVLDAGKSDLEAAHILSVHLGRRLHETSIAGQRRRLFRDTGWLPRRKATKTQSWATKAQVVH